jgi:MFS family permease
VCFISFFITEYLNGYPLVGAYASGPFWGRIVDTRGPRILFIIAFFFLLIGYSGIWMFYKYGIDEKQEQLGTLKFCLLVACSFMSGSGGNAAGSAAVNSTAKSFPDRTVSVLSLSFAKLMLTYIFNCSVPHPQGSSSQALAYQHSCSLHSHTPYFLVTRNRFCSFW